MSTGTAGVDRPHGALSVTYPTRFSNAQEEAHNSTRFETLDGQDFGGSTQARVYGETLDVEPGDVVVAGKADPFEATHVVVVYGFEYNENDGGLDALIIENVPQEVLPGVGVRDRNPHQPLPVNSNSDLAGGRKWNSRELDVLAVIPNRTSGILGEEFSTQDVQNALEAVGEIIYNGFEQGAFTQECDCAGFVNQILEALDGTARGRRLRYMWKKTVKSWENDAAKR